MEHMRLTLAVLAALLALVFWGVWLARGRQHSKKRGAILFYSLLLFASALFLYLGSQNEPESMASQRPKATKQEGDSKASVKNPGSSPGEPTSTESSENTQTSLPVSAVPANPKSEDVWQDLKTDAETQSGSVELSYGELPKRKPKLKSASGKLPKSSKPNADGKKAEDVIEDGILSAFDAIEIFFDTYGSPVAASASNRSGGQSTGSIEFVNGTSELSERSKNYLHSLAPQLGKMYKDGQLEIRAQSNEKADSPAHRFLLTQSRAEAVRDELSDSGFPANRLVPIGSETAGETRVKFVHRPN